MSFGTVRLLVAELWGFGARNIFDDLEGRKDVLSSWKLLERPTPLNMNPLWSTRIADRPQKLSAEKISGPSPGETLLPNLVPTSRVSWRNVELNNIIHAIC